MRGLKWILATSVGLMISVDAAQICFAPGKGLAPTATSTIDDWESVETGSSSGSSSGSNSGSNSGSSNSGSSSGSESGSSGSSSSSGTGSGGNYVVYSGANSSIRETSPEGWESYYSGEIQCMNGCDEMGFEVLGMFSGGTISSGSKSGESDSGSGSESNWGTSVTDNSWPQKPTVSTRPYPPYPPYPSQKSRSYARGNSSCSSSYPSTAPISASRSRALPSTKSYASSSASASSTYCVNSPTNRQCWGEYNINTDYYQVTPDTGVTAEVSSHCFPV